MVNGKKVVLGVTGSIAAYKAADLASSLKKAGGLVDVILTAEAQKFITPLTFSALTHRPVITNLWDEQTYLGSTHIQLADEADLVLIAPATAHILAQMAHGFASDALTCTLLATQAPILVAPAMNGKMWEHAATQTNIALLKSRGIEFVEPDKGMLSCGYKGVGRLAPVDTILAQALRLLEK